MLVRLIIHPFATHPPTRGAVSWNITKATIPKPAACDEKVNGVLANGLMSVTLDVTEKDLRELMDSLSVLEDGLSRRWAELES